MTNDEIYRLCLADLSRVNTILFEIIVAAGITPNEQKRVDYCVKIIEGVTEKQLHINDANEE